MVTKRLKYKTALGRIIDVKCAAENWRFKRHEVRGVLRFKLMRELSFDALDMIIDDIRAAQQHNMDKVILLTGEEGFGKSTLAAHIATRLGMTSPREICWGGAELWEKLKRIDDYGTVWYDEAARGMYRRDWMERFQRRLTKALTQIRIKKLACIICLPHRGLLDSLMERRIGYWGHVVTRGYRRGWVEWAVPEKNKWYIAVNWNGWFAMHFPKFRENNGFRWDEYEKLKREALEEFFVEEEQRSAKNIKPFLVRAIHRLRGEGRPVRDIAQITGMSEPSVYRYLQEKDLTAKSSA